VRNIIEDYIELLIGM